MSRGGAVSETRADSTATGSGVLAPVLRWAGGKRWLVPALSELWRDHSFNNYHEFFLGGASVFLSLPSFGKAYLRDLNADLIETFDVIREDPDGVAERLGRHRNTSAHYYRTRGSRPRDPVARAARFIYLNHTSFNGIYRVNLRGEYNVPYGHRASVNIPDVSHLRAVSHRLQSAVLEVGDFAGGLPNVAAGDLVFLDPPYTVAHNNNGFVKYNQRLFSFEDQERLSELIDEVKRRSAFYFLTNAAHDSIVTLFDKGDRLIEMRRKNVVGGASAQRGSATEYLFTNVGLDD
jgi:DNA adenine methylase